jgi:uncharacterized protein (UPF0216 family)
VIKGKKKYIVPLGVLFALLVGAVTCWHIISSNDQPPQRADEMVREGTPADLPAMAPPGREIGAEAVVKGIMDAGGGERGNRQEHKVLPPSAEKDREEREPKSMHRPAKSYYDRLSDDLDALFTYLDSREYIREYGLPAGIRQHVLSMVADLSANPPVISGETKDIFVLTRNMAHFYRVLGKDNILLIKDVLSHEREILEQSADLIYEWIFEELRRKNPDMATSVQDLYEYAGFFLTTLSGKAYLARQPSKTRMIVLYYSILILDIADRDEMNRYGIDIIPPINLLMDGIENQRNLDYQRKYLRRLDSIKRRVIKQREGGRRYMENRDR